MPWPDDMFSGVGGPGSPGSLDTYGLSDEDHFSTLAAIDAQLRGEVPAPAPEPGPDAVSGVTPVPPVGSQPGLGIPTPIFDQAMQPQDPHEAAVDQRMADSADRQLDKPIEDVTPDYQATPLDLPTRAERQEAVSKLSATELADLELNHELKRRYDEAASMAEASRKEAEQAEQDREIALKRNEARDREYVEIQAEAKRLYDEKIDPDGWRNSRSVPQTIAGLLSVVVGGFGGGPNTGLQMIQSAMEQNIEAQKANLANKRAALGDRRQALGDQRQVDEKFERQANAYRIATYERALRDISTAQTQYDPEGTTVIALEKQKRAIIAEQAKALHKAAEDAAKRQTDALKLAYDLRKTAAETAKLEAEAAKMRGQAAGAGAGAAKNPPEYYEALYGKDARPPVPMSDKEYKGWLGNRNTAATFNKTQQDISTNEVSMSKEQRENSIPGIKNADGSLFVAVGRPEDVSKLRSAKGAADTIVRRMDDALRTRTGWSSDRGNSDERNKLKAQWGQVKLAAKELFDLGAITESDVPLIEGAIGTDDPSSWKDPTAAIMEARRLILDKINTKLHDAGWDPDLRYDIKAPPTATPKETSEEKAFKDALRPVKVSDVLADRPELSTRGEANDYLDANGGLDAYVRSDVQRMLDDLVDRAKGAKDETAREAVVGQLRALAKQASNKGTKEAVSRALALVEGSDLTADEQARRGERAVIPSVAEPVGGPKGSVSYETVPPAPGGKK